MHLTDGDLRAHLDGALPPPEAARAAAHLAHCLPCQQQADLLRARAGAVGLALAHLDAATPPPHTAAEARRTLARRLPRPSQETPPMISRLFAPRFRGAWAALAAAAALFVALLFPPVRALADDFLGLFRVQRIVVAPLNADAFPEGTGDAVPLERIFAEDVQVTTHGEPEEVADAAAASAAAGIPVRLPAALDGPPQLRVQPATSLAWQVNLDRVRLAMEALGRTDIDLPDALDGATVTAEIPAAVAAAYGDCPTDRDGEGHHERPGGDRCTVLLQLASPTIEAPPSLDLRQMGQTFLELVGMPAAEAARFSASVDWATTLVVPIPRDAAEYEEVTVAGVPATLVRERRHSQSRFMLFWVDDDIVYALSGRGDRATALGIAESLR